MHAVAGVKFQICMQLREIDANCVLMGSINRNCFTCIVLSLLDFLEWPTSLNEELAALEATMVESLVEVIDLQDCM